MGQGPRRKLRVKALPAGQRPRIRRTKEQSREEILRAAESILRSRGIEAVTVRAVAANAGMTDATINHHFGTREELLEALLRHGGRRLKTSLDTMVTRWQGSDRSFRHLIEAIADVYADGLYASLAVQLHLSGWRDRGSGLINSVVDQLHHFRTTAQAAAGQPKPSISETRFIAGMIHQVLALDPLFGSAFRRSAGLPSSEEPSLEEKKRLWSMLLKAMLLQSSHDAIFDRASAP